MQSFVPRPIYAVKQYGYLAEAGDTPEGIAEKFGRDPSDFRELVAANLENRVLMPQPLGSPYGSRTFAEPIVEGEMLKIPAHWEEPVGMVGEPISVQGIQVPDGIVQGVMTAAQMYQASGQQQITPELLQPVTSAAVQWYTSMQGTTAAANPLDYLPYVTGAAAWARTMGPQIAQQVNPSALATFPWAALLAWLPAQVNPAQIDWEKCLPGSPMGCSSIPGTANVPWSSIPWAYLATLGTSLEKVKPGVIDWSNPSPAAILAAFKAAIEPALGSVGTRVISCGLNATYMPPTSGKADDVGACVCLPGFDWLTGTFKAGDDMSYNCVPKKGAPQPLPTLTPAENCSRVGGVWDAASSLCKPKDSSVPRAPSGSSPATTALTAPGMSTGMKVALGAAGLLGGLALVIGSIAAAKTMNNEEDLERGRKGNPLKAEDYFECFGCGKLGHFKDSWAPGNEAICDACDTEITGRVHKHHAPKLSPAELKRAKLLIDQERKDIERGRAGNPRKGMRKLKASVEAWDSVHVAIDHDRVYEYGYQALDVSGRANLGVTKYASHKKAVAEAMKKAAEWNLSAREVVVFDGQKMVWKTGTP
jgi:hypothetical protein